VSALRFGDPRVHALLQAISHFSLIPAGFQNRDLRPVVAAVLGRELNAYSRGAMTYDLRRLHQHGLIQRVPRTHRYIVTYRIEWRSFFGVQWRRLGCAWRQARATSRRVGGAVSSP
jgi:hypothetical protein